MDFFILLGVGISRGSLDDLGERCGRVPGAGGRALDGRVRRVGVLASLLEPEREPLDSTCLPEPR